MNLPIQVPHLNPGVLSLYDFKSSKFIITFKKLEELDGWHPVFGKTVYGFDVLRAISDQPLEKPEDKEAHGYNKKVMRYSSTYRHTGLIGH
ncbi:MAG: hypothetical protein SGPRY_011782 [Prymnesium sp.]